MSWVETFTKLMEEGKKEELEAFWLAKLEEGVEDPDPFLAANLALRRAGKKKDAHVLLELATEQAREQKAWKALRAFAEECLRLGVGDEATLRADLVQAIRQLWAGRPSLEGLLAHFDLLHHKNPVEACEELEAWLAHDVGEVFFMAGRGPGRVVEINPKLGVLRLDFEKEKKVPVPIGAASRHLVPLPVGHFLRRRLEEPEKLRQELLQDPAEACVALLLSFPQPLSVTEIREAIGRLLADEEWAPWWAKAKKSPKLVAEGKGTKVRYRAVPAGAAEEELRRRFALASLEEKLELARRVKRGTAAAAEMAEALLREAAHGEGGLAFSALCLAKRLGAPAEAVEKAQGELLQRVGATVLLSQLEDASEREELLRKLEAAGDVASLAAWLPSETNPKLLRLLTESLWQLGAKEQLQGFLAQVFLHPARFAAAWVWLMELTEGPIAQLVAEKKGGAAVLRLVDAGERREFAPYRARIRALLSPNSWVAKVLKDQLTLEQARRLLHILQSPGVLKEERAWLKRAVLLRFPELASAPAPETMVPALRKTVQWLQEQLQNLVQKEIPATLKAIQLAREEGDLRENFEYHAQRARQELLSARAAKLQEDLAKVQIIEPQKLDTSQVRVGCQVELEEVGTGVLRKIAILGPYEANPEAGIYSHASQIGAALLGKLPGEEVTLDGKVYVVRGIAPVDEAAVPLREAW